MNSCDLSLAQILNFARKLSFTDLPRINLNYGKDHTVGWDPHSDIRAANSVNWKSQSAQKKITASHHNNLSEVTAIQNIIISIFFDVPLQLFFLFFSFCIQKTSKSCLKLKRYVLFFSFRFRWKIDLNWIILITRQFLWIAKSKKKKQQ